MPDLLGADGSPGATWNPITGCSVVSPGCANCYAMRLAGTRLGHHKSRAGLTRDTKAGPVWTGDVRLNEQWLAQPLRWKPPRRIFVCAHGDLFHANVPDDWIDMVFAVIELAPQHTFQILTKRAARMRAYAHSRREDTPWPHPNVWLGVSVEDQRRADKRIPHLLATPAAVRWVSAEPLLGPLDLTRVTPHEGDTRRINALTGAVWYPGCGSSASQTLAGARLDWIVAGGESGPGARPMHPAWARSLRDQCKAAGVPFHFKQHGAWVEHESPTHWLGEAGTLREVGQGVWASDIGVRMVGKAAAGRLLDGREHNGMPTP